MTDQPDERRQRGKALMQEVYGFDIDPTTAFERQTVDHLFGEVWADGTLSVRDRRLVLIGLCVGTGQIDVAALQLDAATSLGELTDENLRELVVLLAHYAGWPRAAKLNSEVEQLIGRRAKAARAPTPATSEDP